MTTANNSSVAYVRHHRGRYPVVTRPQCSTCVSPDRSKIERLLVDGIPPGEIKRRLPDGHPVSRQSIYRHFRRQHLPVDYKSVAERTERQAQERWQELGEAATEFMATEYGVAQAFMKLALQRVDEGLIRLTARDLLCTARFLREIEQAEKDEEQGQWRIDRVVEDMARMLTIMGEVAGPSVRNEVVRRACRDETTKLIMSTSAFDQFRDAVIEEDLAAVPPR